MFDATTAALLRSAPGMRGLNPATIPAMLTAHYANLASSRLRAETDQLDQYADGWSLERIADAYEIVASMSLDPAIRRPAAFVAATAQQILSRQQSYTIDTYAPNIDRDHVSPSIAAAILFLSAEQYADANEAAAAIRLRIEGQIYEAQILSEHIVDLAKGRLYDILARGARWRRQLQADGLETQAFVALLGVLITGVELLAAKILKEDIPAPAAGRFDSANHAFQTVLDLSAVPGNEFLPLDTFGDTVLAYAGPHHLASLLLAACEGLAQSSFVDVTPPGGANKEVWEKWLRSRAKFTPYMWPNHRAAIAKGFYDTGVSSVVVLPTGAGKTAISSLKIAGALAAGKKVVFLAPTHALVEQLTSDLQAMFPADLMGSVVSSDFDLLLLDDARFQDIEVMTPERCLAMLSFAPEAFGDVGLLVFDECHLLSPDIKRIRRALDAMLCVLGFNHVCPGADMLFLSAMVKNAEEMSGWLAELTSRPSVAVDLPWKPSRQARGVVIYDGNELARVRQEANDAQTAENIRKKKTSTSVRQAAKDKLIAQPYGIWGLQHNWLSGSSAVCITKSISNQPVKLAGGLYNNRIRITPNANGVATHIAVGAAKAGLKSIVFVNTKADAISVAEKISAAISEDVKPTDLEQARWDALGKELGDLKHAVISGPAIAVPHNSLMLKLERDLCEGMFKRVDGARVIVATPTLAQGLNLPAQMAILAGDKRADAGGRESLEAHEILNAAARAGRAGHLANGLVLLIPDPIISFDKSDSLEPTTVQKLQSVLPEDDHCVTINDVVEVVLDRLMSGNSADPDVRYIVNRFAVLREVEGGTEEPTVLFDLGKSLAAYVARKKKTEAVFNGKVSSFKAAVTAAMPGSLDNATAILATQSGLSAELLMALRDRLREEIGDLPTTLLGWVGWTVAWLDKDASAREALVGDVASKICTVIGKPKDGGLADGDLSKLLPAIEAWMTGQPLRQIEIALGGTPDDPLSKIKRLCPRARELVGSILPRSISFTLSLVSKVVRDIEPFEAQESLTQDVVDALSSAVRRGYDTPVKLTFAGQNKAILSRVEMHEAWNATQHSAVA